MPRIPQYTAQLSRPNFTPVTADPRSAAMPYLAAAQISETIGRTGEMVGAVLNKRKEQQDLQEAQDKHSEFRRELDKWSVDNAHREDYGEAFKEFGDELAQVKSGEMGRPGAAEMFKKQARNDVDSRYGNALETGERNRYFNAQISIGKSAQDAAVSFRTYSQVDPDGAPAMVRHDIDTITASIDSMFGEVAPKSAESLKAKAIEDVITGVIEGNPKVALELIDEYPLDENKRRELRGQANQGLQIRNMLAVQSFRQSIKDSLSNGDKKMEVQMQPPIGDYVAIYGNADAAQAHYNEDKIHFDTLAQTVSVTNTLRGKPPATIDRMLASLKNEETGEAGEKVYNYAVAWGEKLKQFARKDPAGYVRQFNPAIQSVLSMRVGGNALEIDKEVARLTLQYQGEPQKGANGMLPIDASFYMGLSDIEKSVLPSGEAEIYAASINNPSPIESLKALQDFNARYTDPKVRDVAWRDLINLPEGKRVKPGMQLAMLHIDSPKAQSIVASLNNYVTKAKDKGIDLEKWEDKLTGKDGTGGNQNWRDFANAFGHDQRSDNTTVAGFRQAILAYAVSMDGAKDSSVNAAVDDLIGSKFFFADVGGQTLPFAKFHPSINQEYGDDEMGGIVESVSERFDKMDFSNVRTTSPLGFDLFPLAPKGAGNEKVAEYINTQLRTDKMLVPAEDGGGFYVFMKTGAKIPVQLYTEDGKPMFIDYMNNSSRENAPLKITNERIGLQGYNPSVRIGK